MDRIVTYLSDPAWWFTAVFIAILASIAAAFLKDILLSALSKVSNKYKIRKQKRDADIEREINECMSDPTLLILTFCRIISQMCALYSLVILYALFFIMYISFSKDGNIRIKFILIALLMLSGITVVFGLMRVNPRVSLMKDAYRKYRANTLEQKARQKSEQR